MSDVTAEVALEDREKAVNVLASARADAVWIVNNNRSLVERIAAALAEEREKARAPFLALADDLRLEASEQDAWDGNCIAAYEDISDRIRRAAEVTE